MGQKTDLLELNLITKSQHLHKYLLFFLKRINKLNFKVKSFRTCNQNKSYSNVRFHINVMENNSIIIVLLSL